MTTNGRIDRLRSLNRSRLGVGIKLLVSLGLLAAFAILIDYQKLDRLFAEMRPAYLCALVALSLLRVWISAVRFRVLTRLRITIPMRALIRQFFVGAYFSNLLPTAIGGDAVRLFMLAQCGLPKQEGAVNIFIERSIGSAALVVLALTGVLTFPVPSEIRLGVVGLAVLVVAAAAGLLAGRRHFARIAKRRPGLERAMSALALLASHPGTLLAAFILSILFQIASIALSWVVALAFGIDVSFIACLALVPLVWLVTLLPISLGGIGLREASFTYLFGTIGISAEASLVISLGTFAALVMTGSVGAGLVFRNAVLRRGSHGI
jgi:uncharacterized protein (TIRG00374 family)